MSAGKGRGYLPHPLSDPVVELLAERLTAFAQAFRIQLIDHLDHRGEASVQELADTLGATQQNVSKHLGVLRRAGIVARRRDGVYVRYRIVDPDALALLEQAALGVARQLRRESFLNAAGRRPAS
jgi:ArsR family transcriptional regulator